MMEAPFTAIDHVQLAMPAKQAHPAVQYRDYEDLTSRLRAAGIELKEDSGISGVRRCHVFDPFGNRLELIR